MTNETCDLCDREAVTGINEHNFCENHGYPTNPTDWEEQFEKNKREWEVYGPLGMGINYPKLKAFIKSTVIPQVTKEFAERVDKKVIGDDQKVPENGSMCEECHVDEYRTMAISANDTKAEQRQALKALLKEKNA